VLHCSCVALHCTIMSDQVPLIVPELVPPITDEDTGFFFRRIGEICFSSEQDVFGDEEKHFPSGRTRRLAVAPRYGVTVFADFRGKILWGLHLPYLFERRP
jgi:hypothetical protein